MTWPGFPKRLQSALKALSCLAQANEAMQSHVIAEHIAVPKAETAKILQLLVWGGFVTSRRGIKGGFDLAAKPENITMGEVIDFFLARHPAEAHEQSPVMLALAQSIAPCQKAFARLTLSDIAKFSKRRAHTASRTMRPTAVRKSSPPASSLSMPKPQKRSKANASHTG
jgi:Rrf2 family transcriptional regulator, nitric oxide-sensitive transcriptional repressor